MPGTRTNAHPIRSELDFNNNAAVTAGLVLARKVMTYNGRIHAVKVNGATAGTGAGNTVIDLQKNGVSVWSSAANRPTLAATATGEFNNTLPDADRRSFRAGDVLTWVVGGISTTGHAAITGSAAMGIG